jgi:O-antigen ligase
LVGGLSLLVSPEPSAGFVKGFRYTFFIGFLFLIMQLVDSTPAGKRVLRVFCLSTALAAVYGVFSFLSGAVSRASGPILDPNDFGYLMATTIPLAVYLYVEDRDLRPLWIISLLALLGGTFATLSRGAIVGLAALLLWAIVTGRVGAKKLVVLFGAAIVIIVVAFAFWSPVINEHLEQKQGIASENVESRESFWKAAAEMSIDHPVLGVGPARFGVEAPKYVKTNPESLEDPVVHDTYLEILAEDGPIALALFLAMLVAAWIAASRGESAGLAAGDESAARFAVSLKGALIVATVSAVFLSEQIAAPIWLICALAGSGAVLRRRSAARSSYLGEG